MPVKCGLFWDIENVRVPRGELATDIVRSIRNLVTSRSWIEIDFFVACDVYNQSSGLMRSLDLIGLTIIHVSNNVKNAADEKLKKLMTEFVNENGHNEIAIVLLTGDYDFATTLRGFKRNHNVTIYLIYSEGLSQNLVDCVDKSFSINSFINPNGNKPRQPYKQSIPLSWEPWLVQITGYPLHTRNAEIVAEFRKKAQNQNGKFAEIQRGTVWLSFNDKADALKISNELNGRTFKGGRLTAIVTESRLLADHERPTVNQLALDIDRKSSQSRQNNRGPHSPKKFYVDERTTIPSYRRNSDASSISDNPCCSIC